MRQALVASCRIRRFSINISFFWRIVWPDPSPFCLIGWRAQTERKCNRDRQSNHRFVLESKRGCHCRNGCAYRAGFSKIWRMRKRSWTIPTWKHGMNDPEAGSFLHKRFPESRSRRLKDCVHRGLGHRLNKQKNHSFHESGMDGFSHLYIQMHCLPLLFRFLRSPNV